MAKEIKYCNDTFYFSSGPFDRSFKVTLLCKRKFGHDGDHNLEVTDLDNGTITVNATWSQYD